MTQPHSFSTPRLSTTQLPKARPAPTLRICALLGTTLRTPALRTPALRTPAPRTPALLGAALLGAALLGTTLLACKPPTPPAQVSVLQVRTRPQAQVPGALGELLAQVPGGQWDSGLERAVSLLVAQAIDPGARITPAASQSALAQSGYPCPASFMRELTGGAPPERMMEQLTDLALAQTVAVDVAFGKRSYDNGTTLWVAGYCPQNLLLDPIPRDMAVGDPVPVSVEMLSGDWTLSLFVDPPSRPVEQLPLTPGVALWFTHTGQPGEYRFEVVGSKGTTSQVLLLWSVYVDSPPPALQPLPRASLVFPDPVVAAQELFESLNRLRKRAGLPAVRRFPEFEFLAREQAASLAWRGQVAHSLPGLPTLAERAAQGYHPRALHYENVAAAPSWQEAQDLVSLSPGHAMNLLCAECTHVSIGVALEPTLDSVPRLFVVWELLAFPDGEPRRIEHLNNPQR